MHNLDFFRGLLITVSLMLSYTPDNKELRDQKEQLEMIIQTAKTTENGTFILCPICGDELIPDYGKEEDIVDPDACPRCEGMGAVRFPNGLMETCPECKGDGLSVLARQESTENLNDGDDLICPICNGLGEDPRTDKICTSCHGQGWRKEGGNEDE